MEERRRSRTAYFAVWEQDEDAEQPTDANFAAFLADFEGLGMETFSDDEDGDDQEGYEDAAFLMDQAFLHSIAPSPVVP